MRKIILVILLASCACSSGCGWRRWVGATVEYPVIPIEAYPEYNIPEDIKTEKDKEQIVDAVFKAEKHAMTLRKRIEIYNAYAKAKNGEAKELFE